MYIHSCCRVRTTDTPILSEVHELYVCGLNDPKFIMHVAKEMVVDCTEGQIVLTKEGHFAGE